LKDAIQENGVPGLTTMDLETLQKHKFTGRGKKSLACVVAIMNMILRGELLCDVTSGLPTILN
jgi:hypothetical protein